ncbi:MAG: dipeptide epimerase [Chitinophagaceae bacterium]|nr:dipeptide epimerase [Chitinophagaceae bacterium]
MLQIKYKKVVSQFVYPFTTAHGMKTQQEALFVALSMNGLTGIGEAPAIVYYDVTVESMIEELLGKVSMLERYSFTEPQRFWHFCHHLFPQNPFLVCALDLAYWDMYAKFKRKRIHELLGIAWKEGPLTDYTLGIASQEEMIKKMLENPWPIYKIKMSSREDLSIIEALREKTSSVFRVDANASWTLEDAIYLIPKLEKLGVELIEQPLAKDQWDDMKKLKQLSSLPLYADESCVSEHDVKKCADTFHGINIKLTKCSGITPAFRMIEEAKSLGLKVMMGCMNETEIGSYAIAQFLPLLDAVDMDGPLLLKDIQLNKLTYEAGRVSLID